MTRQSGIRLESDSGTMADTFEDVNAELADDGIRAWPRDLSDLPADILGLLALPNLTDAEVERIKPHVLLPRLGLLEAIARAGRQPNVPGGGALESYCIETETDYPQLHVIDSAADYSGFFPLHVNVGEDGVGADEVGQVLWGANMQYRFRRVSGAIVTLSLSCPNPAWGWLFTFNGGAPHGGILRDTAPGTKVLVQAVGPARFHMRYLDATETGE